MRQLCAVLALAAAVVASDLASAQQFDPVARDIRTGVYRGHVVTYEVIDGLAIWDGDIILGPPEELSPVNAAAPGNPPDYRNKISVVSSKESLWPGGIVPYVIDPELENPHVPLAIEHWNENTVIRLVERTDQPNWVRFVPDNTCSSYVGMVGGEQIVNLRKSCTPGAVVHEIGHAVGLWHEHERSDRDAHVWARSHPLGRVDGVFYYGKDGPYAMPRGPYDYGSVMHYRSVGAVRTIPPGIILGRGGPQLGNSSSTGLSAGDIDGVNRLYGSIPTETTVAANVAGVLVEVDGQTYTAPQSFDWEPGSIHTIGVVSPQRRPGPESIGGENFRHLFVKWSDGGSQTHSVTASSETTVFIANFIDQTRPEATAHPPEGGTVRVEPPSIDGFYPSMSNRTAIAEPAEGFSLERWKLRRGPIDSGDSSNPVRIGSGQHYKAFFTRRPLTTIDTNVPGSVVLVDGSQTYLPSSFGWEAGSTHTIGFGELIREIQSPIGVYGRLTFNGWSDGGDATHIITASEDPTTITANFTTQYGMYTTSQGPGTIVVQSSPLEGHNCEGHIYDASTMVQLTAQPRTGSKFVSWLGDLSGTENPQSLLMDDYKTVRAVFIDEHSYESAQLTSGKPLNLLSSPGSSRPEGYKGYWIHVPQGATQLDIRLLSTTLRAAGDGDLYASRDVWPSTVFDENSNEFAGYESQYSATGPGGNKTITITPASSPPLEPGPYFIAVHPRTLGAHIKWTLTAEVSVSQEEIAANVPTFDFPASLITAMEGESPPPQSLEIRNSGRGTLDYQITTDQSWLSVWPDQGLSAGETDTVEITVDAANLEPGVYEGTLTIRERQPAGIVFSLAAAPTPAWPVTIPVTFIIIPVPEEDEEAPSNTISTFVGDGGPAIEARLARPTGVAVDADGILYIADADNNRIRRVDPSGIITTIAGSGEDGYTRDGFAAVEAGLSSPEDVAVDVNGNLYIADTDNNRIRKVNPSGTISTVAGTGHRGFTGDGGPAVQARLSGPRGVAVDTAGNLFIADSSNHRIRRVDPSGIVSTVAGTGERSFGGDGGPAVQAKLSFPTGVDADADGNLYIVDFENKRVRKVDPSGAITTFAGIGEGAYQLAVVDRPVDQVWFDFVHDVAVDADDNLYIASDCRIDRVNSSGRIYTVAGTGVSGFTGDGGPATLARILPTGVAVDTAGNIFIADTGNHRIRKVDPSGTITTVAGSGEVVQ